MSNLRLNSSKSQMHIMCGLIYYTLLQPEDKTHIRVYNICVCATVALIKKFE